MMVEVAFAYEVDVVPKGKRKPIPMHLMSSVVVDVAMATDAEAPVALRWHRPGERATERANPPIDYRRFGDALYVPIFSTSANDPDRPVGFDDMVKTAQHGYRCASNPLFAGEEFGYRRSDGREADYPGAAFRNSKEEQVAATIRGIAAGLVCVDGALFRRAEDEEPIYELHTFGWYDHEQGRQRNSCYVKTTTLGRIPVEMRDIRKHFRVDQVAEVLSAAEAEGARIEGWDPERPETFLDAISEYVEVFHEAALAYRPDQSLQLLKFAKQTLSRDKEDIAEASRTQMLAYADLRDALREEAPASKVCDLLEAYAAVLVPKYADDDFWVRHLEERKADIAMEIETFRLAPLPEPTIPAGAPRP
jgi:hypothetical protein